MHIIRAVRRALGNCILSIPARKSASASSLPSSTALASAGMTKRTAAPDASTAPETKPTAFPVAVDSASPVAVAAVTIPERRSSCCYNQCDIKSGRAKLLLCVRLELSTDIPSLVASAAVCRSPPRSSKPLAIASPAFTARQRLKIRDKGRCTARGLAGVCLLLQVGIRSHDPDSEAQPSPKKSVKSLSAERRARVDPCAELAGLTEFASGRSVSTGAPARHKRSLRADILQVGTRAAVKA